MANERPNENKPTGPVTLGVDKIPAAKAPSKPWETALNAASPMEFAPDTLMVINKNPEFEYYFANNNDGGIDVGNHLHKGYVICTGQNGEILNNGDIQRQGFGRSADDTMCVGDLILMCILKEGYETWQEINDRKVSIQAGEASSLLTDTQMKAVINGKEMPTPMIGGSPFNAMEIERGGKKINVQ